MHASNIEAAKRETLRLLAYTDKVLSEHLTTEDLVREADPEQLRRLDREKAELWKRAIRNEIHKVEDLETVLAVVGTVKAGKSMTIDAIVGAEILPSRPDPMTTYPTFVRHKPGQSEPVLHFPLAQDFIDLGQAAKARIMELTGDMPLSELFPFPRERQIAERIMEGAFDALAEAYEGCEAIFQLLEAVNDLCRLCATLDLPLPTAASEGGTHLPVIKIEMYHVGAGNTGRGQFTILDSPGPNEFKQGERLRHIVHEQLNQASAVLLVCDFTQLNTDADAEVQAFVKEVLSQLTDRLFIFVNKFDQRGARDWGAAEVRGHLSRTLLDGAIPPERIFPVSARSAFHANWALRELALHGRLPDPAVEPITKDFGNEALGKLWQEDIGNHDRTRRAAEVLWHESLFDEPLALAVRAAAANAALICLKAAVAKVLEYNRTLDGFLKIRESAATTDAKVIQAEIEALRVDIEKTKHTYDNTLKHMDTIVIAFSDFMGEVCKGTVEEVSEIIREYFKTGEIKQPTKATSQNKESWWWARAKKIGQAIGDKFWSLVGHHEPEPVAEGFDSTKDFESETNSYVVRGPEHARDARVKIKHIRERVLRVFLDAHRRTQQQLIEASDALSKQVWDEVNANLSSILEDAQERLKRTFDVTLNLPEPSLKISESALPEFDFDVVNQGIETYTRYIEQRGRFGKVKRWFGDLFGEMWGYDEVKESREISTINLIALRDQTMRRLGAFEMEIRMQAEAFVRSVLRKAVDDYFENLKVYIEAFRGDLLDALDDKRLENDRLQALYSTIKELKIEVDDLQHDGRSLAEALEAA